MTRLRLRLRRRRPDPLACREFVELVTDYLEGALPPEQKARFEAHLAGCDACPGYLEDIRSIATTLNAVELPPADPGTHATLLAAFRDLRDGRAGPGPP
jgi:anti-sigma factor RsiW